MLRLSRAPAGLVFRVIGGERLGNAPSCTRTTLRLSRREERQSPGEIAGPRVEEVVATIGRPPAPPTARRLPGRRRLQG